MNDLYILTFIKLKIFMNVSIIVACYNQGKYLAETLDTVLDQEYKNWECIIINDGSSDNTEYVAKSYTKKDDRFKYIYQDNQGVCVARNSAIAESSGKYILCLDADDKISKEYIKLSVKELEQDPSLTIVTCNYKFFEKSNKVVYVETYSIDKLMGHNLFVNCSMFRRLDFDRVNGFNLNMKKGLEDWDFWLSILKNGGRAKCLDGIHFFYRIKYSKSRNNSINSSLEETLRKQMWLNHKDLYCTVYSSPKESIEYIEIVSSKEYRIGNLICKIISLLIKPFLDVKNMMR